MTEEIKTELDEADDLFVVNPIGGAKALYDAFHREYGVTRYRKWEENTPTQQARWSRMLGSGIAAALSMEKKPKPKIQTGVVRRPGDGLDDPA